MNVDPIDWARDIRSHRLTAEELEKWFESFDENKLFSILKGRLSEGEFVAFSKMFAENGQKFIDTLEEGEFAVLVSDGKVTEGSGDKT